MMPLQTEAGNTLGFVKIMQDKTESRQAAEREQFLAQSSIALAASIDYKTTLTTIARLAVPFLADYCFFDVVNTSGQIERVAWHIADLALQDLFDQVQQFVPPQDFDSHPIVNVLRSGHAHFVPIVTQEWMQSVATSSAHSQFMQQCRLRSLMTVPLKINHRSLGALTFCFTAHSNRRYTQAELTLAEELARRAALALDNAKLYHQAKEANRIKDEFLAVLSHELRSPLNPILGWAKLLLSKKLDETKTRQALITIERNAKLQSELIEDLLDVSRILQGKLSLNISPVGLASTIGAATETVRLAAEAKSVTVEANLDSEVGQILGDATRLQQVVWNLLSNAVKFTPAGGRVEVRLEQIDDQAQITVRDTGKGIAADFLPYVFDYFRQADSTTTRKFGGLGLGLAIVRHLVELHGGTVWAESQGEGLGATFVVRLPLMPIQPTHDSKLDTPSYTLDLTDIQVLVVDDEADSREFIAFVLEQGGAQVRTAASAIEAFSVLTQSNPDVLLSDIGMPDIDGYTLMQQVRSLPAEQGGKIAAIALTAYAGDFDRQQALKAGFQRHIAKPIEPQALIEAITAVIKRV
ncbi:hypothetical protein BWI75_18570 [Gloeocapsopsis sp. AAB1 = 1H9]|uniref:Circadian input-output histidine kinase CikA n=2 Tax=Gloeocapsopsis TaxID=693222 RepID=A0A6N8FZJ2_9CHRO|nr:hypothetical protein [Gloeocapsopsis dulcis AAB1 = 1H9]